jgi:hypothetical protein
MEYIDSFGGYGTVVKLKKKLCMYNTTGKFSAIKAPGSWHLSSMEQKNFC